MIRPFLYLHRVPIRGAQRDGTSRTVDVSECPRLAHGIARLYCCALSRCILKPMDPSSMIDDVRATSGAQRTESLKSIAEKR